MNTIKYYRNRMWKFFNLAMNDENKELHDEYYNKYKLYSDLYFASILKHPIYSWSKNVWLKHQLDREKILTKLQKSTISHQDETINLLKQRLYLLDTIIELQKELIDAKT